MSNGVLKMADNPMGYTMVKNKNVSISLKNMSNCSSGSKNRQGTRFLHIGPIVLDLWGQRLIIDLYSDENFKLLRFS